MAATEESVVDDMKHCYENLILIDVGANLTNKKYSRDLDAVVQRAQDSGQLLNIHLGIFLFLFILSIQRKGKKHDRNFSMVEKKVFNSANYYQ